MIRGKKKFVGVLFLAAMMAVTGAVLFKGQSFPLLWESLKQVKPFF